MEAITITISPAFFFFMGFLLLLHAALYFYSLVIDTKLNKSKEAAARYYQEWAKANEQLLEALKESNENNS